MNLRLSFLWLGMAVAISSAANAQVTLNTDFPGGNVSLVRMTEDVVELKPDLRGGRDWFYWCFEATADRAGDVTFEFPEKVAGFRNGAVGFQGPAVSKDGGKTWNWRGSNEDFTSSRSFTWSFKQGDTVRFASVIPYTGAQLKAFDSAHAPNAEYQMTLLTKTRKDRDVHLIQIGKPAQGRIPMLMTCRHHACESIASYLLEGILAAAMSDSPAGQAFRERFVLYVVPIVDVDGVEEGDQGKNRAPHDHNRDYGEGSIYRSVEAIKNLALEKKIQVLLDLHCPTLVMDIHQRFYFAGPSDLPAHNEANVRQFADLIKAELPKGAPHGPVLQLRPSDTDRAKHCSGFFSKRDGALMSTTLETPFAPRKTMMAPDQVRSYGTAVLRALNRLSFKSD